MDFRIVDPESEAGAVEPVEAMEQPDLALEGPTAGATRQPDFRAEEATLAVSAALEELSQEVRRVGRELFKANRAAERNHGMFEAALEELQQLAAALAHLPGQSTESGFQAKASLCEELIRMADALEASLASAKEILARLQENAQQPNQGIIFWFSAARHLRAALVDSVEAMSRWRDGQQLLYQRLTSALNSAGVRAIESIGRPFDPALHRAVAVERRSDVSAGTIVGEELKGYILEGRVLRYTEVVVARNE